MAKPFDATTKRLLEIDPVGWLRCAGLPVTGRVRAVDSELSTITAEADTIIQVGDPVDYLAHIEIQAGHDLTLPRRLLHYNVLLNYRHDQPVRSVVVIPRQQADSPSFTGRYSVLYPEGSSYLDFQYSVLRVWTLDVNDVLQSGLGTVPLAPLAKVRRKDLPSVIARIKARFDRELTEPESSLLWTATKILMGLKYSADLVDGLLRGIQNMKESMTYQTILREGRVEGEQHFLLKAARKRLGEPSLSNLKKLEAIVDESTLSLMIERLFDVSTWEEFLSID